MDTYAIIWSRHKGSNKECMANPQNVVMITLLPWLAYYFAFIMPEYQYALT
jgi:hypothetical protein